jgi:hypothetical protein
LQRSLGLIDLALRGAAISLGRVLERIELGLRRSQIGLRALHIGDSASLGLGQLRFGAIKPCLRAGEILLSRVCGKEAEIRIEPSNNCCSVARLSPLVVAIGAVFDADSVARKYLEIVSKQCADYVDLCIGLNIA